MKFATAGGAGANHIAQWDGTSWLPLGSGMNNDVIALTVYNGKLIAEMQAQLGYLPESPYFYDYLTAEELLMYFAGLFGLPLPVGFGNLGINHLVAWDEDGAPANPASEAVAAIERGPVRAHPTVSGVLEPVSHVPPGGDDRVPCRSHPA